MGQLNHVVNDSTATIPSIYLIGFSSWVLEIYSIWTMRADSSRSSWLVVVIKRQLIITFFPFSLCPDLGLCALWRCLPPPFPSTSQCPHRIKSKKYSCTTVLCVLFQSIGVTRKRKERASPPCVFQRQLRDGINQTTTQETVIYRRSWTYSLSLM